VLLLVLVPMGAGRPWAATPDPVPALLEPRVLDGAGAGPTSHGAVTRAVRSRPVTARVDLLTHEDGSPRLLAGQRIGLNLFDDATFTATIAEVTRHASFGQTWSGRLDGVDLGHVVLAAHGGALVGVVTMPGAIYRIGYAPDGTQVVEQIDPATLPGELDPVTPPALAGAAADLSVVAADSASQIDVMVVYTANARAAAGGTSAMLAEVALAVATANQAYANNGLVQRLRLVYAGESSLTESGSFNNDLGHLTGDSMVAWLRDANRADLVSLITSNGPAPPSCGIGWLMLVNSTAFAPFGFNVVDRLCASSNLTFPHELGHNMGAHHDPFVAGSDQETLFPYSHGYVDLVGKFRTIMAYDDQCKASGFSCTRIQFFSTPALTYNGRAIGDASTSDNSRTLAQTGDTVANFRHAVASSLSPSTGVNQPSFAPGQTVVTTVTLDNAGGTGDADIYVGLVFPGGVTVFFTGGGGFAVGDIESLPSFRPIATGVPLAAPFSITVPGFFSYRWTGIEPHGGFVFFLLVVKSGGLAAGLTSDQILGVHTSPFTFP
jgi:hypothetical protein